MILKEYAIINATIATAVPVPKIPTTIRLRFFLLNTFLLTSSSSILTAEYISAIRNKMIARNPERAARTWPSVA